MILAFHDKETEKIFNGLVSRKFPLDIQARAFRKLAALHTANCVADLQNPPSNRLEELHGDRAGQYSIRINDKYRICFVWIGNNAIDVEVVDYH
ncbi:plasmid maintenance system killer protein [Campylobacterota bacterium]|nr:plasmid maintenance system killer protein [Campylobacterota bacterium]